MVNPPLAVRSFWSGIGWFQVFFPSWAEGLLAALAGLVIWLVLLPAPRHRYILGKNLALFPIVAGVAVVLVAASAFFVRYTPLALALGLIQLVQLYLIFSMIGNFVDTPDQVTQLHFRIESQFIIVKNGLL